MTPSECARELAKHFGTSISDDSFVVERNGRRVRITVDSNSGTIHGVTVTVFGPALPEIEFTHETSFDLFGKQVRVAREAQLGDPSFDPHVYVDSTLTEEQIGWLLTSTTARTEIVALLKTSDRIAFGEAGIATTTMNERFFVHDAPRLMMHIDRIFSLYAALPAGSATLRTGQRERPALMMALVLIGALGFAAVFTAALLVYGSAELFAPWTLAALGLGLSIAAWIPIIPIAALVLSGRSYSFRNFVGFAIASFFVLLPAGPIALCVANAELDESAVRDHRMPVRNAYM